MTDTPQNAPYGHDGTEPAPGCPPAPIAPQEVAQAVLERPQNSMQAIAPKNAVQAVADMVRAEIVESFKREIADAYRNGYAAARRHYGDTAPLALDKIRARLDQFRDEYPKLQYMSMLHNLFDDLHAILDTAKEPR